LEWKGIDDYSSLKQLALDSEVAISNELSWKFYSDISEIL